MASFNDIKNGQYIVLDGDPFVVLSFDYIQMQQRKPTIEMRVKNLRSGQVLTKTYKAQHDMEEADIEKDPIQFIYAHRDEYWFQDPGDPKSRFALKQELIGEAAQFLKSNIEVTALKYNGEILNIELPIKMEYTVIEAPPGIKGDTASGGTKPVVIDSVGKTKVNVPLFINSGDIIRINTQTGTYDTRMEKGAGI